MWCVYLSAVDTMHCRWRHNRNSDFQCFHFGRLSITGLGLFVYRDFFFPGITTLPVQSEREHSVCLCVCVGGGGQWFSVFPLRQIKYDWTRLVCIQGFFFFLPGITTLPVQSEREHSVCLCVCVGRERWRLAGYIFWYWSCSTAFLSMEVRIGWRNE